ncbi:cation:proton antiporter [Microbacterium oryzae]|uniref:cation:proton antiporter domain-containing protein n=1 Tax=Microbacterium oryzae TaxID=743009 RepID=UPI0025B04E08|nr:cation:proton antiporter [Microbacterium oryzae]MDN3309417.1 cation:proton antiporter [Microbacterium oryzae]
MPIYLALLLFAGAILLISAFSSALQRKGLPGPLLALAFGVFVGPHALGVLSADVLGIPTMTLLEEAARLTLAIGLSGVALRLPHGYWRQHVRWVAVMIGIGMLVMLAVAAGVLWALLGLPLVTALLLGAIITPTDPIVTTPIVTGSLAEKNIPDRVRFNVSSESGINDGLGYLFVFLPILLMTKPDTAWSELLTTVLLREVLGAAVLGVGAGYLLGHLYRFARSRGLMEESSYLGFIIPLALVVLGSGRLLGVDALLAVFLAAAVFGQVIPQGDEEHQDRMDDTVNRFFILPIFMLLGLALPIGHWVELGWLPAVALLLALVLRRVVALWTLRPLLRSEHSRVETAFLSWFGPIGVSALFYATLAHHETGDPDVFGYVTMAITISVVLHGVTSAPFSYVLHRREQQRAERA